MHRYGALTRALGAGALALLPACGHRAAKPAPPPPLHIEVRFLPVAPRRCIPSEEVPEADVRVARLCAQAFVRQNGLTPERGRDTSLMVRESFEIGSWSLLIEKRRYTLESKPEFAACEAPGCIVYFRRFQRRLGCLAVTMSFDYDILHVGVPAETELIRRRCP